MKLKTNEFKKNNYFVIYEYDYKYDINNEDEIICYIKDWKELHSKYLKNLRASDLVYEYNRNNTNIINVIIDDKKYKLATFCDEEADDLCG